MSRRWRRRCDVRKAVRADIDHTAEMGDQDTADVFTEVSRGGIDKSLWFVEAGQAERASPSGQLGERSRLYRPRRPGQGKCGAIVHLEAVPLLGFTVLWTTTVVSNIGAWMHDVGAGWLMTSLAPSPFVVALVQGGNDATDLPAGAARGALADIVDRRKVLLAVTLFLTVVAAARGGLVWLGLVTPWVLLVFTFLMGAGAAFAAPAWQAIVPTWSPGRPAACGGAEQRGHQHQPRHQAGAGRSDHRRPGHRRPRSCSMPSAPSA